VTWENCSQAAKPFLLPPPTSWPWRHEPQKRWGREAAALAQPDQAWENRQYVRTLLTENNPLSPPRCKWWNKRSEATAASTPDDPALWRLAQIRRADIGPKLGDQARALAGAALHDQFSTGGFHTVSQTDDP